MRRDNNEGRRRSGKKDALTTRFRPLVSIIKTAATLAMLEGAKLVERKHVKEAIEKHCKTIQRQILEHQMQERGKFLEIKPYGAKIGQIYGLGVVMDPYSGEMTGNVLIVKGILEKRKKGKQKSPGVLQNNWNSKKGEGKVHKRQHSQSEKRNPA